MASPTDPQSILVVWMNIVNTVTNLLLGGISISAMMYANSVPLSISLKQHIYLCVLGYIILMSQAVLAMSPYAGWSSTFNFQERKNIHWIMQVTGAVLAISGSAVRISGVNTHFQSAHAAFGILALIFTCLTLLGGVCNLFSDRMNLNVNAIKIIHSLFGCLTLFCAFFCLIFGFDQNIFRWFVSKKNADMLIALTVFAFIGTILPACMNFARRIRN